VKEYPESSKIAEARFAQAAAFRELAQVAEAILILDEVINNYPDSDLVAEAWARKGDCHFALGSDDPKRYEEAIKCYKVAVNHVKADRDLVISSQYMIGSCLEKQGKQEEALEQYYEHVLMFFTVGQEKGVRHTEEEKIWFIRASVRVADMLEARQEYRRMVKILDRVVNSGVPGVEEFKTRAEKVRSEHWWLFY